MRPVRLLPAVLLALALVACGSDDEPTDRAAPAERDAEVTAEDPAAGEDESGEGIAEEGSITTADGKFVQYPDGVVITFKSVEKLRDSLGSGDGDGLPPGQSLIKATVTVENKSDEPVPMDEFERYLTLLYGENKFEAESDEGFVGQTDQVTSKIPQQIAPGSTLDVFKSFAVPNEELKKLALLVELRPGYYTPFTFTDVETAL